MPDRLPKFAVHCALVLAVALTLVAGDAHTTPIGVLRARGVCVEVLDAAPGPRWCGGGRGSGRERVRSRARCARVRPPGDGRRGGQGGSHGGARGGSHGGARGGSHGGAWGGPWVPPPRCRHR